MEQTNLRLFGRIDGGPAIVPTTYLKAARTYREVVRLCWKLRKSQNLKPVDLGRLGFIRQHASDYLNPDDAPGRRDLPAERIADFECVCENSAITQWLAARQNLTLLEEMQAERAGH